MKEYRLETGLYVMVEGTDGAGSSTQIEDFILPWLLEQGLLYGVDEREYGTGIGEDIVLTREPGGTEEGEYHRYTVLHDEEIEPLLPIQEYKHFLRAREVLSRDLIVPQLALGKYVVSERSRWSSEAYQGGGRGVDIDYIRKTSIEAISPRMYIPDAVVFIAISLEEAARRRGNSAQDKIERRKDEFFKNVHEAYLNLAEDYNIPIIDGEQSRAEVGRAVIGTILDQIGRDRFKEYVEYRKELRAA